MRKNRKIVALLIGLVILALVGAMAGCSKDKKPIEDGSKYPVDASHTITYMLDGGSVGNVPFVTEFKESEAVSFSDYAPTKDQHTFEGWYLDASFAQPTTGIDVGTKKDVTVYAHFVYGTDGLAYTLNADKTGYLVSVGTAEFEKNIAVPATYLDLPVVGVQDSGFARMGSMQTIALPNSIKTIGEGAFMQCYFKNITLPQNLESLGMNAFDSCQFLTEIEIPRGVKLLPRTLFRQCSALKKVTFQAGSQCQSFGKEAFWSCRALETIIVPASVTTIKENAFYFCEALNSVTFEEGSLCVEVGIAAFGECKSLLNIVLPNAITKLDGTFVGCLKLASITLPAQLQETKRTFDECLALSSIQLPESLVNIGESTFVDCKNLKTVGISSKTVSIADNAFENCASLLSIALPPTVANISPTAYLKCNNIESIYVDPANTLFRSEGNCLIEKTPEKIVKGCKNSQLPEGIKAIGENAFWGCATLTTLQIPSSVEQIASSAFAFCSGLTKIDVSLQNTKFRSEGNCLIEQTYNQVVVGSNTSILPANTISICEYAFSGRTFASIDIPASVSSIGASAFEDCVNLVSVVIPNRVTYMPGSIFAGCTNLTSIIIPISVTNIGFWNFLGCPNLTIKVSVTEANEPVGWENGWNCDRPVVWGFVQ